MTKTPKADHQPEVVPEVPPEAPAEVVPEVPPEGVPEVPEPQLSQGMGGPGPFPAAYLLAGDGARRAEWGPGFQIVAAQAGGRSGQRLTLMTTGSRSGLIEWKPVHLADELLAQDWHVVPSVARDPMP